MVNSYLEGQSLHEFLLELYNYADQLLADAQIQLSNYSPAQQLLTAIFIERFFDSLGRQVILEASKKANQETSTEKISEASSRALSEAHSRLDLLRGSISKVMQDPKIAKETLGQLEKFYTDTKIWLNGPSDI